MSSRSGATALPIGPDVSTVCYDPEVSISQAYVVVQQPTTVPIANLVSSQKLVYSGNLIDVNSSYIVYGVKNGLVRIIDRHSATRTLLRGHNESIKDVAFYPSSDGTEANVVATVGGGRSTENNVLIWRILKDGPDNLTTEKLLEIKLRSAERIIWHPFHPNQLVLSHRITSESDGGGICSVTVASYLVTTNIMTETHSNTEGHWGHAVCYAKNESNAIPGALQLVVGGLQNPNDAMIQDMCWSQKDTRHIMTVHSDGAIRLWDLSSRVYVSYSGEQTDANNTNATTSKISAKCLFKLQINPKAKNYKDADQYMVSDDLKSQRCIFLHKYDHAGYGSPLDVETLLTAPFITSTRNGCTVTLWTPFSSTGSLPSAVKVFELTKGTYHLSICTIPQASLTTDMYPSTYLIFADESEGYIYALHFSARGSEKMKVDGSSECTVSDFDFVVPFQAVYPVYSMCTRSSELSKDIELFCVQSKSIQMLSLASSKCSAPPPLSNDKEILPPGVTCLYCAYEDRNKKLAISSYDYEELDEIDTKVNRLKLGGSIDQDADEDDINSANQLNAEYGDTVTGSLPDFSVGDRTDAFSNWLGSLASMEQQNFVPPTPQVTPHVTPLVKSKVADKSILSGIRDISDLSLPTSVSDSSTTNIRDHCALPVDAVQAPLLIPSEVFSASASSKVVELHESIMQGRKTESAVSVLDGSTTTTPFEGKKNIPTDKKATDNKSLVKAGFSGSGSLKVFDQKGTKSSSKELCLPKADSKVTILKRTEESESQDIIKSSVPFSMEELEVIIRKAVASQLKHQEQMLVMEIQKSVRSEMHSFILPSLNTTITQSIEQAISKTLEPSLSSKIQEVSGSHLKDMIETVKMLINDTFYSSMREFMVPAYESATKEMFGQISSTLQSGLTTNHNGNNDLLKVVHHMAERMNAMSKTIELLIATVNHLSSSLNAVDITPSSELSVQDSKQSLRQEIEHFLNIKEYERAFTKALSISDVEFALLVCKNADLQTVLEGEFPCLSQPILLCLMQQLGTNIANASIDDTKLIVAWLQSIAIILDPNHDTIKKHVANICAQVTDNINRKLSICDFSIRRPLQMLLQVIRGICTI